MPIELLDKAAFISAAKNAPKPVAFLLGSPLSQDSAGGVPGINTMLDLVRDEVRSRSAVELARLENDLKGKTGAQAYQTAMKWLQGNFTQDAVNRVVSKAVLQARKAGAPPDFTHDGTFEDWHLPLGTRQVAALAVHQPEQFPGPLLTTNFDPLLSLAVEAAGGRADFNVIDADGSIGRRVENRPGVTEVVHLHGYWRGADTLHTPAQLTGARPRLKASLQNLLRDHTLIVAAYGGWDDVFSAALSELLNDNTATLNVLWCFRESDASLVEARYAKLFERVAIAITRGRFLAYGGIDCHSIFAELGGAHVAAGLASSGIKPPTGWDHVDSSFLAGLPPLQPEELVRYFDGAAPNWRHAISAAIPRRQTVATIVRKFVEDSAAEPGPTLQLIRAAGGEGKTTMLLQTAADIARFGGWTVLSRAFPAARLPSDYLLDLDPATQWLFVVDDAESIIDDLTDAARRLHDAGRRNIHFLLAARDTDWRMARGDGRSWDLWLTRRPDITLRGITPGDATALVEAWSACGADGLRELAALPDSTRARALEAAVKDAEKVRDEGSLFGGLLAVRFGQRGLQAHARAFLNRLKDAPIEGSNYTLRDALVYVAACHAVGITGLHENILADLVSVPRKWVQSRVVRPLGEEAFTTSNAAYVFTRHRHVANAILVEIENSSESDLAEIWSELVSTTVATGKEIYFGDESFPRIVHAGPNLQRELPKQLPEARRKEIAIAAATAAMNAQPERTDYITDLGRTYRLARDFTGAVQLARAKWLIASKNDDASKMIRGYLYEWGISEGFAGNPAAGVWLQGLSLSDHLQTSPIDLERAKLSCAGLGAAFGKLAEPRPDCPFACGRRAAVFLGRLTSPDPETAKSLSGYDAEADKIGTPQPKDIGEAIKWLKTGVILAGKKLTDPLLKRLVNPARIAFEQVGSKLEGKR